MSTCTISNQTSFKRRLYIFVGLSLWHLPMSGSSILVFIFRLGKQHCHSRKRWAVEESVFQLGMFLYLKQFLNLKWQRYKHFFSGQQSDEQTYKNVWFYYCEYYIVAYQSYVAVFCYSNQVNAQLPSLNSLEIRVLSDTLREVTVRKS